VLNKRKKGSSGWDFRLVPLLILIFALAGGQLTASEAAEGSPQGQSSQDSQQAADADDEQDAQTKAMDSTATQWQFQFAFQAMPDYHQDTMDNGQTRPAGSTEYFQFRIVQPHAS